MNYELFDKLLPIKTNADRLSKKIIKSILYSPIDIREIPLSYDEKMNKTAQANLKNQNKTVIKKYNGFLYIGLTKEYREKLARGE